MPKVSWLARIRQKLNLHQRRQQRTRRAASERLEARTYLSVSSLLVNNQLRIIADGDEAIAVGIDPLNPTLAQVLIDGNVDTSLPPIQASQLRSIEINAGQGNNLIDLNAITSTDFTFVNPVTGDGLQILVDAGNGNDTLFGSQSFDDTLEGGDGHDAINVAPANSITVGQSLVGGDGDDTIAGGDGNDSIHGRDGNDSINGGLGDDLATGGDGRDTLTGDDGNDVLNGNQGEDSISGSLGNDTLTGDSGQDVIQGEDGDDAIAGGGGHDLLFGDGGTATGQGNDSVNGNSGDDTIRGGGGADLLLGQSGDDRVSVSDATFSVSDITINGTEGDAGQIQQATFTVSLTFELSTQASVDVTVEGVTATVGQDFTPLTQTVVFAPGVTSQQLSFDILGDDTSEQDETIRVTLSNPVGAAIQDGQGTGTIVDDDAPPPSAFDIVVLFSGGLSASQQAIFTQAEQRLEQIIIGDILDITVPGFGLIDDVIIDASGVPIDGVNGILGQAGPIGLRPASFLPYAGIMQFDTADLGALEAAGELDEVILHEMMHVLGFGTIWSNLGLLINAGTADPRFIGAQATSEFNLRFGTSVPDVPVENTGGPGTADGHWRESVFNNEIMTGFLNSGQPNPLSRITIAQFADLGYQVNISVADPYLVAGLNAGGSTGTVTRRRVGDMLDTDPIIGLPGRDQHDLFSQWRRIPRPISNSDDKDTLPIAPPERPDNTEIIGRNANLVVDDGSTADSSADAIFPNIVTTLTFDEVPTQPVDNLTVSGVSFDFKVGGVDSTDANYNSGGPGNITYLQGAVLEGNAQGVLTFDFATPVSSLSFGVARSTSSVVSPGIEVELFDSTLTSLGVQTLDLNPLISFSEGLFTYAGTPISRAVVDFTVAPITTGGARFALDNLTFDDTPVGPPPASGSVTIMGGDGNDTLTGAIDADIIVGDLGNDQVSGGGGNDTLYGGGGLDTMFGGDGNDSVFGQGANDSLQGGGGDDFVDGGDGNNAVYGDDSLNLLSGNDTLVGGLGNDRVFGGNGNDLAYGGSGRDQINGGAGDDTLHGQGSVDTLIGGTGNDELVWRGASDSNDVFDTQDGQDRVTVNGSNGPNQFAIGQNGSSVTVTEGPSTLTIIGPDETVGSPVEQISINALAGNDTVTIGNINNVGATVLIVNCGLGNDVVNGTGALLGNVRLLLNGDEGLDSITGTAGGDEINGGVGNDTLNGSGGNDLIHGNADDDVINGGAGNDSVLGDEGNDSISGGEGQDNLDGGFDNDTVLAGAGHDTAIGGFGDDLLNGDVGNDLLEGNGGLDSLIGAGGNDTLDGGRNDDVLNGNGGNDKIRGDHGNDVINAGDGNDTVDGGDGNDTIDGGAGNNGIAAGDGNDSVIGGPGADTIVGGDGNDSLLGGAGNDIILGGDGDDVIGGNSGDDTLAGNEGSNSIAGSSNEIEEGFTLTSQMQANLDASN